MFKEATIHIRENSLEYVHFRGPFEVAHFKYEPGFKILVCKGVA